MTYICAHCGAPVEQDIQYMDHGTLIFCPSCQSGTVVGLYTQEEYDEMSRLVEKGRAAEQANQPDSGE
jgi:DNA-directed RNA polymerase subunit RPC12/RpoP